MTGPPLLWPARSPHAAHRGLRRVLAWTGEMWRRLAWLAELRLPVPATHEGPLAGTTLAGLLAPDAGPAAAGTSSPGRTRRAAGAPPAAEGSRRTHPGAEAAPTSSPSTSRPDRPSPPGTARGEAGGPSSRRLAPDPASPRAGASAVRRLPTRAADAALRRAAGAERPPASAPHFAAHPKRSLHSARRPSPLQQPKPTAARPGAAAPEEWVRRQAGAAAARLAGPPTVTAGGAPERRSSPAERPALVGFGEAIAPPQPGIGAVLATHGAGRMPGPSAAQAHHPPAEPQAAGDLPPAGRPGVADPGSRTAPPPATGDDPSPPGTAGHDSGPGGMGSAGGPAPVELPRVGAFGEQPAAPTTAHDRPGLPAESRAAAAEAPPPGAIDLADLARDMKRVLDAEARRHGIEV